MTIYNAIDINKRKSLLLAGIFVFLLGIVGYLIGQATDSGYYWMIAAVAISTLSAIASYYYSDRIILTISGAKSISENDYPELYHLVENLCIGAGLPRPRIYLIEDTAPNAFATGRDPKNAVICFTTGIIQKLSRLELEGVVAHEISHIKNYDIRFMSLVTILVGAVTLLADWYLRSLWFQGRRRSKESSGNAGAILLLLALIMTILSPIFAQLIQFAVSRRREFLADASGVLITRYPEGLASALSKISADREPLEAANRATAPLYIVNPIKGAEFSGWLAGLFSTHPPVEERIRVLRSM